jgi:glycosyltransferase involved in cell wall biosynthesis
MNGDQSSNEPMIVLLPLYNDWESLQLLLAQLDGELARKGILARVLVVDDGSPHQPDEMFASGPFEALAKVEVLTLWRNLGHQRAIAIGLAYVAQHIDGRCVVVMDSDGEDSPADVPRLLAKFDQEEGRKIVFAERTKRSETLTFMAFYLLYRWLHFLLTGVHVRVGNFSVIPRSRLESLVVVSELWNHYAAAVFKSRQPHCSVPTRRAKRLSGHSRMNFVGLVIHGLSALSVFSETIGARLLILNLVVLVLAFSGVIATVVLRFGMSVGIPGWATNVVGILLIIILQTFMLTVLFCFGILGGRQATAFIPRRDYAYFAGPLTTIYPRASVDNCEPLEGSGIAIDSNGKTSVL